MWLTWDSWELGQLCDTQEPLGRGKPQGHPSTPDTRRGDSQASPKEPNGEGTQEPWAMGRWPAILGSGSRELGSVASGGGIPTARLCPLPPAWDLGPDASQAGCLPPCWPGGPGWVAGLPGQAVAGGGGLGMHTQPLPLAACPGQAPRGGGASMALPAGAPLSPSRPLRPLPRRRQRQRPRLCLGSPPARNAPAGCLAAAPGMG